MLPPQSRDTVTSDVCLSSTLLGEASTNYMIVATKGGGWRGTYLLAVVFDGARRYDV